MSFQQTPWLHNIGSFANSSKYYKHIDSVLKEELSLLYIRLPGFFKAYLRGVPGLELVSQAIFKRCKDRDTLLYQEESS